MLSALFAVPSFEVLAPLLILASALILILWGVRFRRKVRQRRLAAEISDIVRSVKRVRAERDPVRRRAMERDLRTRFRALAEGDDKETQTRPHPHLSGLYRALAQSIVLSPEVDLAKGREIVEARLGSLTAAVRRYGLTFRLLCEAEASVESQLFHRLPESGQRALLLVYFHALEEYLSRRLRLLVPRGATLLLGDRGHLNLRRRGWESRWASLSLGNLVYLADWNRHLFLADDQRWNREIEPRLRQALEARNRAAHPGWPTPPLDQVHRLVYGSLAGLEAVLKAPLAPDRLALPLPVEQPVTVGRPVRRGGSPRAR